MISTPLFSFILFDQFFNVFIFIIRLNKKIILINKFYNKNR